jgi:hypothetical protein
MNIKPDEIDHFHKIEGAYTVLYNALNLYRLHKKRNEAENFDCNKCDFCKLQKSKINKARLVIINHLNNCLGVQNA